MKKETIIYKGNHSGLKTEISDYDILGVCSFSEKAQSFINTAIAFSKRHKADIVIAEEAELRAELYIQLGSFMSSIMFSELIGQADDMLIMPISDSPWFSLKIILYHTA